MTLLICGIFKNGVNEVIFKTVTSAKNKLASYQWGKARRDKSGDWD